MRSTDALAGARRASRTSPPSSPSTGPGRWRPTCTTTTPTARTAASRSTYLHPDVEAILGDTYGLMIYQESVMRVAQQFAGYSLAEADNLRKACGKKSPELIAAEREKFVAGCDDHGLRIHLGTELLSRTPTVEGVINVLLWPRMTHDQLARVFPDGRTVHVPTDGKPLKGYELARADIEKRDGDDSALTKTSPSLWAALFKGKSNDEEDEGARSGADSRQDGCRRSRWPPPPNPPTPVPMPRAKAARRLDLPAGFGRRPDRRSPANRSRPRRIG